MIFLAQGSVNGAIQAAQIAALASIIGAIVSIIIAVYNNRMRLKAEEKMYVAKMYIEKSAQLQKALDKFWKEINEIDDIVLRAYHHQISRDVLLNSEAYKSLKDGVISPDWLEIERIGSYYPELIESINDLKKSFESYYSKLENIICEPGKEKLANFIENEIPGVEINIVKVKENLQSLVTTKIRMMNNDNKSFIRRFVEWLEKM